ncbi:MAG: LytTR family transcriptional regulator [Saprospiraceae bacterium]|nr:LytTR family transcriptional regulator [Bacteroidia bacterium]NNL93576.1 LytTR family transcriptional regulator [Saprospiraceae bacterium]
MLKLNPNSHFSTMHFLLNLKATFLIGIFPLLFFGSLIVSKRTKENANIADSIHVKPRQLEIENENKIVIDMNGQNLYIRVEDFVLAEAMQNYVTIYHLNNEQQIIKTTFRSTLKSFLEKVNDHQVLQSHRSYIVNCVHIKDVSGNAQGLKLELQNTDIIVPVSRKYIPLFRSKFN